MINFFTEQLSEVVRQLIEEDLYKTVEYFLAPVCPPQTFAKSRIQICQRLTDFLLRDRLAEAMLDLGRFKTLEQEMKLA